MVVQVLKSVFPIHNVDTLILYLDHNHTLKNLRHFKYSLCKVVEVPPQVFQNVHLTTPGE